MDKRALKREYKESQRPMGVFRVRNTASGKSFIGTSVDLTAMLNRQRSQLKMGGHPNREMQTDYNEVGEAAFEFEILDELPPSDSPTYDPKSDLRALEEMWIDRENPEYNTKR